MWAPTPMGNEMIQGEIIQRVRQTSEPLLIAGGLEPVEIEFRREARGWVLRLYIDKEGGVTLDDCTWVNQELGRILDIEDFIPVPYTLEVSSPGLNRPLKQEKDFIKYHDRQVRVTTNEPIGNRRHFKGRLRGIEDHQIRIEVDQEVFQIPLTKIAKAHLETDPFDGHKSRL